MPTVIEVEKITRSPRGRKAVVNTELLDALKQVKPGFAVVLDDVFGEVPKEAQSKVSQQIRSHFKMAHGEKVAPRIDWTPKGLAQVSIRSK